MIGSAPLWGAPVDAAKPVVDFNREVRPILSDACFACHGPDETKRMAGLRLDVKEGAFADKGSYQIIVPGSAQKSRLYQRITAEKKAQRMPPPGFGRELNEKEVAVLRKWIDTGARWETHWSYAAPKRPALPEVKNKTWVKNPIDAFVLARLEKEGLKPSAPADRATLLRRVTFDLTGLPPTPEEIDAFVADKSPDAYEKRVEQLLKSPRYGERMAMQWMDVARYADTHGYHIDSHRDMWLWRDWVIGAFNKNLPFNDFVVWQMAGDLLPNATLEQKLATGFHRNHMINFEGGAIPEEYRTEYVADRTETTAVAFLGMTLGCARCHDHKYDPLRNKEFYQFFAFFNNLPERGLDGQKGNANPILMVPSAEQKTKLEQLKAGIREKEAELPEPAIAALEKEWRATKGAGIAGPSRTGLVAHYELDEHLADTSGRYQHGRVVTALTGTTLGYGPAMVGKGADFNDETYVIFGESVPVGESFSLAFWMRPSLARNNPSSLLSKSDGRRGIELLFDGSKPVPGTRLGAHLRVRLMHDGPEDAIVLETKERIAAGFWYQVTLRYDGSGKASGVKLSLNTKSVEVTVVKDALQGPIASAAPIEIGAKRLGGGYRGRLDDLRLYEGVLADSEIETLAIHYPAKALLAAWPAKPVRDDFERARKYYLTYAAPENYRKTYTALEALRRERDELMTEIPTTMVMADALVTDIDRPRDTFVLVRGSYANRGEKVQAGVPAVLPPLPAGAPRNRLGLAKWLTDPANPLVARVTVNRYWQMYFGTGIVKTAEDFGSQGEPPVNQELLDWLATEFVESGWDVKGLQRKIVTSATYRQASKVTPELLEKDPENRLLARMSRFRLPAEMVRDNALAVSGLLNPVIGGKSVFPYQPKGLWEEMAFGAEFSAQEYVQSTGSDLYRRSMYTFWKRTVPPAQMSTFDAPDREKCTVRRAVTNTPLQALVLLNDPTYVEASRTLAQRMILEAGADPVKRVQFAYRRATGRAATAKELQILRDLAAKETQAYKKDLAAADKLLHVGESAYDSKVEKSELAAWTTVASVILNLDETVTKE